MFLDQTWNH